MDYPVTVGGLLAVLAALAGLALLAIGALFVFGAGMATSPNEESGRTARQGCSLAIVGLVLLVSSCAGWIG